MALNGVAATIIGATANILAQPPQLAPEGYHQGFSLRMHYDNASGLKFVHHLLHHFPELRPLKETMIEAARLEPRQALEQYRWAWSNLQRACTCSACPKVQKFSEESCLGVTMQTILSMGMSLTSMIIDDSLSPTRAGFEAFRFGRVAKIQGNRTDDVGSLDFVQQELRENQTVSIDSSQYNSSSMLLAAILFGGRECNVDTFRSKFSAISNNGICVYVDTLREPSLHSECVGRVHVIPGKSTSHNCTVKYLPQRHSS